MIRKGRAEDIAQIAAIYDAILTEEEKQTMHVGWVRGIYPTEQTARDALAAGELFVMEQENRVVAAARINQMQVPEYKNANWKYKDVPESKVMVLHTLVVDPSENGKGYGTTFVNDYEAYAAEQKCPYLRMDTNAKNQAARRLYASLGYEEVGIVPCSFNGIPGVQLVCLEKTLPGVDK